MRPTINFTGNYGSFDVDAETGVVVSHNPDREEIAGTGGFGYLDIVRVDLAERREWYRRRGVTLPDPQPDGDVLDASAWCADVGYIQAPDDWRREVMLCHYPNAVALDERPAITFRNRVPCSSRLSVVTSLPVEGDNLDTLAAHAFNAMWSVLDWTVWTPFEVEGQRFKVQLHDDGFDDDETCMEVEAA